MMTEHDLAHLSARLTAAQERLELAPRCPFCDHAAPDHEQRCPATEELDDAE